MAIENRRAIAAVCWLAFAASVVWLIELPSATNPAAALQLAAIGLSGAGVVHWQWRVWWG